MCVFAMKKKKSIKNKRGNVTAAWTGTDGTGNTVKRREGKSCSHTTKKHQYSQHLPYLIKVQLRTGVIS